MAFHPGLWVHTIVCEMWVNTPTLPLSDVPYCKWCKHWRPWNKASFIVCDHMTLWQLAIIMLDYWFLFTYELGNTICIMPYTACLCVTWLSSYECSVSLNVELRYEDVEYSPPSSWLINSTGRLDTCNILISLFNIPKQDQHVCSLIRRPSHPSICRLQY